MRSLLLIAGVMALVAAPATASCHACLGAVVDECGSLDPPDCQESSLHLAGHAPALVMDLVRDASDPACDPADGLACR